MAISRVRVVQLSALTELLDELALASEVYVDPVWPDLAEAAKTLEKMGVIREAPDPDPDRTYPHYKYYVIND